MSDDLRARIVAVQAKHVERQLTNYDMEREECGCGHQGSATYREHLADAVICELGMKQEWALRSGSDGPVWAVVEEWSEWCGLETMHSDEKRVRRYVTDWTADDD